MLSALRHRTRDSGGFTLIEMMVAMAAGIVVLFGLSDLMIATLHQSQRTFTRIDATRQARTALANIENELHSACLGASAPIQGGSTADSLAFVSFYGTAASPTPVWHQLTFDPTAGTLTDKSYGVTGSAPAYLQGAYQSTNTLLTNVTRLGGTTPAFQYYAYAQVDSDASGTYWVIPDGTNQDPVTGTVVAPAALDTSTGLTSTAAATVVEVVINLSVGATASNLNAPVTNTASNDPVTDAISLRLTTPPNEVAAGAKATGFRPCQ
jgi:prepilin-type N-terminal cleavage/methylation domain-containing protein